MPFDQIQRGSPLRFVEVADLLVADELQFGIVEAELVHDGKGMAEVPADSVRDHAEFHGRLLDQRRRPAPTISS